MTRLAPSAALVTTAALALMTPRVASAQTIDCSTAAQFPCEFQIESVEVDPVPAVFKFQARVSQARLSIGEGVFDSLFVRLKRGDEVLCLEEFANVRVKNSVMNLEVGPNMNCELADVIANNNNLAFQVCIGGQLNCLRPISLGTMPYAIKSSFANQALEAHRTNVAAQAHYAQRASADRHTLSTGTVTTGYFSFETPDDDNGLFSDAEFANFSSGGFLTWVPANQANPTLTIASQNLGTGALQTLDRLVLYSSNTKTTGPLEVESGGLNVTGGSQINGDLTVTGQLKVDIAVGAATEGLQVTGSAEISSTLSVSDGLTVEGGGISVTGHSEIDGTLTVDGNLVVNGSVLLSATGRVQNMADPVADTDAANKRYVDAEIANLILGGIADISAKVNTVTASNGITATRNEATVSLALDVAFLDNRYILESDANDRYLRTNSTFYLTEATADARYLQDADADTTYLRLDGTNTMAGTLNMNNHNITNVGGVIINDPGANEGIRWRSTTALWSIDVANGRGGSDGDLNLYGRSNGDHDIIAWRPLQVKGTVSSDTSLAFEVDNGDGLIVMESFEARSCPAGWRFFAWGRTPNAKTCSGTNSVPIDMIGVCPSGDRATVRLNNARGCSLDAVRTSFSSRKGGFGQCTGVRFDQPACFINGNCGSCTTDEDGQCTYACAESTRIPGGTGHDGVVLDGFYPSCEGSCTCSTSDLPIVICTQFVQ